MTAAPARSWDDRWLDRVELTTRARSDARFAAASAGIMPRQASATPARAIPLRYLNRDQHWQHKVRQYDREGPGFVGYSLDAKAQVAAMVPLHMEKLDAQGKWARCEDPVVHEALAAFKGTGRDQDNLVFTQFRAIDSVGEYWLAPVDTPDGLRWIVAQTPQLWFESNGRVTIRLRPEQAIMGTDNDTIVLDRAQVVRCHHEDAEWPGEAYSAYRRALPDIERYRATVRNITRTLDSRLLTNGLLWFAPSDQSVPPMPDSDTTITTVEKVMADYMDVAWKALGDDSEFAAFAPFPVSGASKPEYVKVGRDLDPDVLAAEIQALDAVGRSLNFPQQLLVSGPGAGNHWSDLLLADNFLQTGIAPGLGEVCGYMTTVAVRPVLDVMKRKGAPIEDVAKYRVWYDLTEVAKRPDTSDQYLLAWDKGLLGYTAAGAALGLSKDEMLPLPPDISEYEHWRESHSRTAGLVGNAATANAVPATPDPASSPNMTAAASPVAHTSDGVMIALVPDNPEDLTVPNGDPAGQLHLTLVYLGSASELTPEQRGALQQQVAQAAAGFSPTSLRVSGTAMLGDDTPQATALLVEGPTLHGLRDAAIQAAAQAKLPNASAHPGFIPHMTVGYGVPHPAGATGRDIPVSRMRLSMGGTTYDYPLGARTAAVVPPFRAAVAGPDIGPKLSAIDRKLFTKLSMLAEVAYAATIAEAGRNLMRLLPQGDLRTSLRGVPFDQVWFQVPADVRQQLGFTESDVLGPTPFGTLDAQAQAAFLAAADEIDAALDDEGIAPGPKPDSHAAAAFLVVGLTAYAIHRLNDPHSVPRGELSTFRAVPPGIMRDTMRVAAGGTHVAGQLARDPDGKPQLADGSWRGGDGPASGPLTLDYLVDQGRLDPEADPISYTWVHGDADRPFAPHLDVDGLTYTASERDEVLANPGDWPDSVLYPGDHNGCTCWEDISVQLILAAPSAEEAA